MLNLSMKQGIMEIKNNVNRHHTIKPPEGDIKSLKGTNNEYRLRVGKYRIIYHYENDNLVILDIGSRGDIYK